MARPRKQTYTMSQYLKNYKDGYISNDADTQRNPAWEEIVDGLVVTILTDDYIPPIILAEEDSGRTVIVDGGSRTVAFKKVMLENHAIKKSVENSVIPYKKLVKDTSGKVTFEDDEFDIKGKKFEQFPSELQKKFEEYQVETVIHEHCNKEIIAKYVKRYNEHKSMTTSQKMFVYVPNFAEKIREIKNKSFFVNCCDISQREKETGVIERILTEAVMVSFHFDKWNKTGNKIAKYVNDNASLKEFERLEDTVSRLGRIVTSKRVKELFNAKNSFVWFSAFENFKKLDLEDAKFGEFLEVFASRLKDEEVDGLLFDGVDGVLGTTKSKKCISAKLHIIETLLKEFLDIKEEPEIPQATEEIISELLEIPVEEVKEDMEIYEETLASLEETAIRVGSKLLDKENHISLLAMVAYSYKTDVDLDEWMERYSEKTDTYLHNQKKNFMQMKEDFDRYIGEKDV